MLVIRSGFSAGSFASVIIRAKCPFIHEPAEKQPQMTSIPFALMKTEVQRPAAKALQRAKIPFALVTTGAST